MYIYRLDLVYFFCPNIELTFISLNIFVITDILVIGKKNINKFWPCVYFFFLKHLSDSFLNPRIWLANTERRAIFQSGAPGHWRLTLPCQKLYLSVHYDCKSKEKIRLAVSINCNWQILKKRQLDFLGFVFTHWKADSTNNIQLVCDWSRK